MDFLFRDTNLYSLLALELFPVFDVCRCFCESFALLLSFFHVRIMRNLCCRHFFGVIFLTIKSQYFSSTAQRFCNVTTRWGEKLVALVFGLHVNEVSASRIYHLVLFCLVERCHIRDLSRRRRQRKCGNSDVSSRGNAQTRRKRLSYTKQRIGLSTSRPTNAVPDGSTTAYAIPVSWVGWKKQHPTECRFSFCIAFIFSLRPWILWFQLQRDLFVRRRSSL